ncbi:MAG TPA: hypothetical protein VNR41_11295 [Xanthobacteraceae bacterium]|jgi:hypothetical protein|nr:hypothetical protein [Xanthobacteraceae bacterium]
MIASTEFRRHAAECKRMARTTIDRDSRATWKSLADRWITAAELAERAEASMKPGHNAHRAPRRKSRFDARSLAH